MQPPQILSVQFSSQWNFITNNNVYHFSHEKYIAFEKRLKIKLDLLKIEGSHSHSLS